MKKMCEVKGSLPNFFNLDTIVYRTIVYVYTKDVMWVHSDDALSAVTVQTRNIWRRCCSSTAASHGSKKNGHLLRIESSLDCG